MINENKFLNKTVVFTITFILLPTLVNTNVHGSVVIRSQIFQASLVHVDFDYGNGDPNDDNNNDQIDATHKKTIQDGITAVDNGGTVNVWDVSSGPGEYRENVNINKPLTMRACSQNATICVYKWAKHRSYNNNKR